MLETIRSFLNFSNNDASNDLQAISKLNNLKIYQNDFLVSKRKQPVYQIKKFFSEADNKNQFIPDGIPFQGEFDHFFDLKKGDDFYGFYRICVLPSKSIEIHCGFTHFNSLLARRYLQITEHFLKKIIELFPKNKINSECLKSNKKANNYLLYFCFELKHYDHEINYYLLNYLRFKNKFLKKQ